jgi:hypothetical protein
LVGSDTKSKYLPEFKKSLPVFAKSEIYYWKSQQFN